MKWIQTIVTMGKTIGTMGMIALAAYFATPTPIAPDAVVPVISTLFVSPDPIAFVVMIGTTIFQEPLIYRNGISPLLKENLGIELGKSTIAKLFSPAVGQGCEPACYWNKRPLYRPADVLAWAKSKLRPGPGVTPMSAEETPAIAAEEATAVISPLPPRPPAPPRQRKVKAAPIAAAPIVATPVEPIATKKKKPIAAAPYIAPSV
jgi:hypothetical protein